MEYRTLLATGEYIIVGTVLTLLGLVFIYFSGHIGGPDAALLLLGVGGVLAIGGIGLFAVTFLRAVRGR